MRHVNGVARGCSQTASAATSTRDRTTDRSSVASARLTVDDKAVKSPRRATNARMSMLDVVTRSVTVEPIENKSKKVFAPPVGRRG
jgi:hypothetical protein